MHAYRDWVRRFGQRWHFAYLTEQILGLEQYPRLLHKGPGQVSQYVFSFFSNNESASFPSRSADFIHTQKRNPQVCSHIVYYYSGPHSSV